MDMKLTGWSEPEQAIAKTAFDRAYQRAIDALIAAVRSQVEELTSADAVWQLHDFLSSQRHVIEGRFAFSSEGILFVFASLVKEGLLQIEELQGLDSEKLTKVKAMARF